jgi:hypothetical protein
VAGLECVPVVLSRIALWFLVHCVWLCVFLYDLLSDVEEVFMGVPLHVGWESVAVEQLSVFAYRWEVFEVLERMTGIVIFEKLRDLHIKL